MAKPKIPSSITLGMSAVASPMPLNEVPSKAQQDFRTRGDGSGNPVFMRRFVKSGIKGNLVEDLHVTENPERETNKRYNR
ncbi:hypothetical protein HOY82DRAFT_666925 [Tuber indicum]|nr:hypothetical protein HOY82DRAFT_666925 [Tuber indicum]